MHDLIMATSVVIDSIRNKFIKMYIYTEAVCMRQKPIKYTFRVYMCLCI